MVVMGVLAAIHLASLMTFQSAAGIPFITADARQREAATHLGLGVVWVG